MSIYKNQLLVDGDTIMRVVKVDEQSAWFIQIDNPHAWPIQAPVNHLIGLPEFSYPKEEKSEKESKKRLKKRDEAYERLRGLIDKIDELLIPHQRNYYVNEHAENFGCSERTLHKDLRRFWQGGQIKAALMPTYHRSGRAGIAKGEEHAGYTAGRGRTSEENPTFQMTQEDEKLICDFLEKHYLQDKRVAMLTDVHWLLLNEHYSHDFEGKRRLRPAGEYPSYRQVHYLLHRTWDIEKILRSRKGKDYSKEDRAILGTVLEDCVGVGHYYEIDATICDVYLVAKNNVNQIIGKPTLYTIRDRYSRLFVGFYFGLEHASWAGAMQAILSIAEDKQALCSRYGVEYREEDWPAHQVFPAQFLADRGDMISYASASIADRLHCTVTNVPGLRPDWKPLVECGFKQIQEKLRIMAPAYDPPSNATRRRGKNYKDAACLTMQDFGNLLLNTILKLNRDAILNFKRNPEEIMAGIESDPISLWNYDIAQRSGALTKYDEEQVRLALLRREVAMVKVDGIHFNGLHYSFADAIKLKWFEVARKNPFEVDVAFDTRLCDTIYVYSRDGSKVYLASLMEKDVGFSGRSYEEAKFINILDAKYKRTKKHPRTASTVELIDVTSKTVEAAKKRLKDANPGTRKARRVDVKDTREAERAQERAEKAALGKSSAAGNVVPMVKPKENKAQGVATDSVQLPRNEVAITSQALPNKPVSAFANALASLRKNNTSQEI